MQGGEDDLDALLAQFKLQDQAANQITLKDNAKAPPARVHASFTPIGTSVSKLHQTIFAMHAILTSACSGTLSLLNFECFAFHMPRQGLLACSLEILLSSNLDHASPFQPAATHDTYKPIHCWQASANWPAC